MVKTLQLVGAGIGLAVGVAVFPLALGVAVALLLLASLNRGPGPQPAQQWPDDAEPPEPLLGNLRRLVLAKVAEPEPQNPTDEELLRTYGLAKRDHNYEGPLDDWPKRAERAATVAGLRAVLARWGNYPGSPDSSGNLKSERD